jgi:alpha-L-rhamnosidase
MRKRPDFIWTPHQPVNPLGFRAVYLGAQRREDGQNRWFLFRRKISLPTHADQAPISITVDGRYLLTVNGRRIGRGPVRSSPLFRRFDTYDLADVLREGENVIAVLVHCYGVDTAFYESTKGMWQPSFGDGGLWLEGHAQCGDARVALQSDENWRCTESHAWTQDVARSNHSLGFIEDFDAEVFPDDWTSPAYDDSAWDLARAMQTGGGGPEAPYGGIETRPFPILLPRVIPALEEREISAARIVWIKALEADPQLSFERRSYEERLLDAPDGAVKQADDLLKRKEGHAVVRTSAGRDVSILLDFGRIMTGHPFIEIEARGGEIVEIACVEGLPGEFTDRGIASDARPTPRPWLGNDAHLCRFRAKAGVQRFERFEWCAIRWVQLTVRNAPDGLVIRGFGANLVNYPVEERGRFETSDPFLNKLWTLGAYTLRQCMHDSWEDCPSREQRQWLGDVTVENLVGHAAFGPSIAPLTAKFLQQVAESQRPDGLTQMFAPGDHKTDALLIPDWTLQWILAAEDHWTHTADRATIDAIYPSILKALAWFENFIGASGLAADVPYWHFMDWAGLGRAGEAGALNAQLAGSFRSAARLGRVVGWDKKAEECERKAGAIAAALETRHWDAARHVYVDCVDPATATQQLRVSQHANAAIALWGSSAPDRIDAALDRIVDSARLTFTAAPPIVPTGETLNEEEGVVLANTFYSHFVYEALAKRGRFGDALRLMRERYGPMLARGATTLWESFGPTASLCHGFSATPTYQLSRHVLGVKPAAPGFAAIELRPHLHDLEFVDGIVPTVRGDVNVRLEKNADGFSLRAQVPKDITLTVAAAPGLKLRSRTDTGEGVVEAAFEHRS